jgi:hypothetical protein
VGWFREWITNPTSDDATHESGFGGHALAHAHIRAALPSLRGKNLACWCKPGQPCHADVLLKLAVREAPTVVRHRCATVRSPALRPVG